MKTYPLESISLEKAKRKQFQLIDEITKEFSGTEFLTAGDYGIVKGLNKPVFTEKVERVLANFFKAEKALLVTGSGTGALRMGLLSVFEPNDQILVHTSPIYPTTEVNIKSMGLKIIRANFNDLNNLTEVIKNNVNLKGVLIQYTRQALEDSYDLKQVIDKIKSLMDIPIIVDDNYAVMKVDKIGVELGADLSCFSCFKLLGPEGVGLIVGKAEYIDKIDKLNYSGGTKVQGPQAMEVLRGLIYAPVALAIQAEVNEELLTRLNNNEVPEVKQAFLANAQSKVLLVEFKDNIAKEVLKHTEALGGLPNPVGAESKYEALPLFYRVSGTFIKADPALEERMIRINPNRSGSETVIRILKESIKKVK